MLLFQHIYDSLLYSDL